MSKAVPRRANLNMSSGMSTTRMISRQKGKMSKEHGCTSGNPQKGLYGSKNYLCRGEARFSSGGHKKNPDNIG